MKKILTLCVLFIGLFALANYTTAQNSCPGTCIDGSNCSSLGQGYERFDLGSAYCQSQQKDTCCKKIDNNPPSGISCASGHGACIKDNQCPDGFEPLPIGNAECQTSGYNLCCTQSASVNECVSNGGTCIDIGKDCKKPLSSYDNACDPQICCKDSSAPSDPNDNNGSPEFTGKGIEIPEGTGLSEKTILEIITNLLDWLLTIFLILALIAFVITGVQYLLAMGNSRSDSIENAKNNFRYAIIAVVTVGAGYIILKAINSFLNANPLI